MLGRPLRWAIYAFGLLMLLAALALSGCSSTSSSQSSRQGHPAGAVVQEAYVTAILDLGDFGDAVVVLLLFVGGLDDSRRHGMVRLGRS